MGALCDLRASMNRILQYKIYIKSNNELVADRIKAFIFSDTILIFSKGAEQKDLTAILILTSELFSHSLFRCVPLRGGIAFGDFYYNLDLHLFCGKPFVKAYKIGEKAQWLGIVVDKHIAKHYSENPFPTTNGNPIIIQ